MDVNTYIIDALEVGMVRNENECDQCLLSRKFSKLTSSIWRLLPSSTEVHSFIVTFPVSSVSRSLARASLRCRCEPMPPGAWWWCRRRGSQCLE